MSTTQSDRTSLPMPTVTDLESLAERVDRAVSEAQSLEPASRVKALALKSAIEEFHKLGLTQIVRTLKSDPRGKELLFGLVEDPTVYALFSMHGLVRADLRTRVSRVIDMVRPYMQSHGGDVHLVDVRERTVRVSLSGNCNGCSMSSATLRNTVEESLREHVPEIEQVEVVAAPSAPAVVQIGPKRSDIEGSQDHGWIAGPAVADLPAGKCYALDVESQAVVLVPTKSGWRAYRNACAHQGLPLDGGILDEDAGTLTCPWHGFQFDAESGECFSAPQCQLEAFAMRIENDRVWIRLLS